MSKEVAEEYASSLADLKVNSKPLINMLTILAEENTDHAGVIVETVEKHLEKVHPDIKLPVLYLVDSIIKNVGGPYTQKFSQSIVNMFTRTFKQVDEKTRSQMFKLRETWHDVFPATKLYQLDVKVNLIDPAWPIQAQPQQSNIHVNPNFLKKPVATTSTNVLPEDKEEQMRSIVAKKEQELLMLRQQTIDMELEQTRRQFELSKKASKKILIPKVTTSSHLATMPIAMVNPVVTPIPAPVHVTPIVPEVSMLPVKQRLGPPVNSGKVVSGSRIAPVSGAMLAAARRDPRLARHHPTPVSNTIASNHFDIKPLERVTKRKNVITIDVTPQTERKHRDPRLEKREEKKRNDKEKRNKKSDDDKRKEEKAEENIEAELKTKTTVDEYINRLQIPDPKKICKLPPIPKIVKNDDSKTTKDTETVVPSPTKKRKEVNKDKKKKHDSKDNSDNSSPEKKARNRDRKKKEQPMEVDIEKPSPPEQVEFKELKNYNKERYMRRNKEKSESPEKVPVATTEEKETIPLKVTSPNIPDVLECKDVDLRVLHAVAPETSPATIVQKRPSTEVVEVKQKKSKIDKFDILFGNEDVDLRQLPQVEETNITESPKVDAIDVDLPKTVASPILSPKQKDWSEVKDSDEKKGLSELDLVRAKLAVARKGRVKPGKQLIKSPSIERERRRTISAEDTDLRAETEDEVNKETISLILTQAKEHYEDGKMDKNQYNTLMFQVMQLNEKLKLKEAKQRESLEMSKRKLHRAQVSDDESNVKLSPPHNKFGDIDERITPFIENPPNNSEINKQDFDMRLGPPVNGQDSNVLPLPPMPPPMFMGPQFPAMWRGMRPPLEENFDGPRRPRGPAPPFFRNNFGNQLPFPMFPPFETSFPQIQPKIGICQGECPLKPYQFTEPPPPLGTVGIVIPPTDFSLLEYIDRDPMKTIEIDGVPREIRFYGQKAIVMLDWDDPREIRFLPGSRRITFDNKDSVVINFNDDYKSIIIDDKEFDIRFGAPTRELYINGKWYECFFGGPPVPILIDRNGENICMDIHLEGPPPQVDIGKDKETNNVAGKINMIVDGQHMCPVFLDAKVQKFSVDGQFYTIRFADCLKTVLINEVPFQVEFGGLPKPVSIGQNKHFIRFSVLPKNIKPGLVEIANMEGLEPDTKIVPAVKVSAMETDQEEIKRPQVIASPEGDSNQGGLDMLASLMPSTMAPASSFSGYSLAEPTLNKPNSIPGLETKTNDQPHQLTPSILGNINVNDLFEKLVATGIVKVPQENKPDVKEDPKKVKEDKNLIHHVDLLKPETLRVKQPGVVARLYSGMQCSGCGARFPPERTVRYSQHLDWHFRENRRQRDSARRAHSRRWDYTLADWLTWGGGEDADGEKVYFDTLSPPTSSPPPVSEPSSSADAGGVTGGAGADAACGVCGDRFRQLYDEEREEWRLRNAVWRDNRHYHPMCYDDLVASQTKEEAEETMDASVIELQEKMEEPIEIGDVEDTSSQDNDDDVLVVEQKDIIEAVELDEADDDVIYKAEPVEEVLVQDDDTDDETADIRAERDKKVELDLTRVKQEPVDPDDEPVITAEQEAMRSKPDVTTATVLSSIDGNVQLDTASQVVAPLPAGGIRINISKSIPVVVSKDKELEDISADEEPPPPGEESELDYTMKPGLNKEQFIKQPTVQKGTELSGLCSIM